LANSLLQGDSGYIKVSDNLKIYVVASKVLDQHQLISHERIHFNGQLYAGHVHAQHSSSCLAPLKVYILSLSLGYLRAPPPTSLGKRAGQGKQASK
jgi:hypothetical protein